VPRRNATSHIGSERGSAERLWQDIDLNRPIEAKGSIAHRMPPPESRAESSLAKPRCRSAATPHAIGLSRHSPQCDVRYIGSALVQDRPGGRIRATKSDRLVRYLQIPGPDGPRDITVRGSKAASKFANYKAAINRLLRGDRNAMAPWHGKRIAGIELITDTKTLVEQARKEILPYGLYRSLSGGAA
jgi:hypothetical protein